MTDGQLLIDGEWVPSTGGRVEEIRSPYDGRVVGQAAVADLSDADKAQRDGAGLSPAVVDDVAPSAPLNREELFGPAVAVSTAEDWATAIACANSTPYGLGAGVFTKDVSAAVRAMRQIDAGVVHINWTPLWRADLMPSGGPKASGIGKEGFRTAVAEMTEEKTIFLHGQPW